MLVKLGSPSIMLWITQKMSTLNVGFCIKCHTTGAPSIIKVGKAALKLYRVNQKELVKIL